MKCSTAQNKSFESALENGSAEMKLRENERILNQTGHMARIGGWEHDLITGRTFWTNALYEILEIKEGPPQGLKEFLSYYPPKHRKILHSEYDGAI